MLEEPRSLTQTRTGGIDADGYGALGAVGGLVDPELGW